LEKYYYRCESRVSFLWQEVFLLKITDIRVRRTYQDTRLKALVSLTVDNDLAVHDIKVIEGPERLFVAMPSRKDDNGVFRDICHPITADARSVLENTILAAYREHLERTAAQPAEDAGGHGNMVG